MTVYNRVPFNTYNGDSFQGVRIVRLPTIQAKGTDTLVHSALCTAHSLLSPYDIIYFCGVGSAIFSSPARLRGASTIVNVDGADWQRAKWGRLGKLWLRWSEAMAARLASSVIADHPVIAERYKRQFGIDCELISYGAEVNLDDPGTNTLEKFGLKPDNYLLYVSRLTPENAADLVMESHLASGSKMPLVVVGDAPYLPGFLTKLHQLAESSQGRILMIGYQFGEAYRQLSHHARGFVFPTSIEATRPVLLEQMGSGGCVIARDTPSNRHILGDAAVWFDHAEPLPSLTSAIREVTSAGFQRQAFQEKARERIRSHYSWDHVTDQYEILFKKLRPCAGPSPQRNA